MARKRWPESGGQKAVIAFTPPFTCSIALNFMKHIDWFCSALLLSLLPVFRTAESANSTTPNIVILYADDMGYGDLGVQNPNSKIPTPHLDQLAREGMRFTDAHSSSGVCTPSRYAMLHGRYHWRKFHGIVNSFDQPILDDARLTVAELLKVKGYRTACIGKWHLGWDWNSIKLDYLVFSTCIYIYIYTGCANKKQPASETTIL